MNFLGKVFCSKLFSYLLGFGTGLVGFYVVNKVEEQKKLESMQREIEATVKSLEARRLALVETGEEKNKT
ncbi:MAG TPA: hypothetical protein VH878_01725 [Thermodesulfobacteriota bacterium]|jgi:hypothetical protein